MAFWDKQPASRLVKQQNLAWTGTGTVVSTLFASETWQIRICSQVAGWFNVDVTGQSSTPTTAGGVGYFVPRVHRRRRVLRCKSVDGPQFQLDQYVERNLEFGRNGLRNKHERHRAEIRH